jgi:CrcB protein
MKIQSFLTYMYVGCGGALGSVLRVYLSTVFPTYLLDKFPLPILLVNILGCFCMGVSSELMGVYLPANYYLRLFLVSGFLGGFTTFSAFSLEFALLWQKNLYFLAVAYCLSSLLFSIIAFFLGVKLVKLVY